MCIYIYIDMYIYIYICIGFSGWLAGGLAGMVGHGGHEISGNF